MLPEWNPDRLMSKLPGVNILLCGIRRGGKSNCCSALIERTKKHFDLVIAFVGSASCNPVLEQQMIDNGWDTRFFFSEYKDDLMNKLLQQQQDLKKEGRIRRVLVIVDDVILQGRCRDSLANLGIRGRHFFVSIFMCCVSYTTAPKRLRGSLDCLLVFSLPMSGDLQVLLDGKAADALFKVRCSGVPKVATGTLIRIEGNRVYLKVNGVVDPKTRAGVVKKTVPPEE